jgi:hypothetical protein
MPVHGRGKSSTGAVQELQGAEVRRVLQPLGERSRPAISEPVEPARMPRRLSRWPGLEQKMHWEYVFALLEFEEKSRSIGSCQPPPTWIRLESRPKLGCATTGAENTSFDRVCSFGVLQGVQCNWRPSCEAGPSDGELYLATSQSEAGPSDGELYLATSQSGPSPQPTKGSCSQPGEGGGALTPGRGWPALAAARRPRTAP